MERVHLALVPGDAVSANGSMIPFTGPDRWRRVSASALLDGNVPRDVLAGKVVLVGTTASGLAPRYPVSGRGTTSGLEIDAHLLSALLDHRLIRKAGLAATMLFTLTPLWLLMLMMGPLARFSPSLCLMVNAMAVLAISAACLLYLRVWLPPCAALLALCIVYPVWGWRQLAITQQFMRRELERLRSDRSIFPQNHAEQPQAALPSTIALLTAAIADNRDMKHFIADRLDQLPDATIVTNVQGDILLANACARTLFGKAAVCGDPPPRILGILARFQQPGSGEPLSLPTRAEGAPVAYDTLTRDGHSFAIRFAPQRSVTGNFLGWIVQFMDVSEARAAQRQRDDILELLTHDMRSPQASILAVLETAPAETIAPEVARRIRHYAERTLGLADGFVQLARAEALDYKCR